MIRVVLVDDDKLVRAGLAMILQSDPEIEVVSEASRAASGVEEVRRTKPDVVIMDVRMPGGDGIEATKQIVALEDPPRVLVLTTFHLDEYVLAAVENGAAGFLLKDTPPRELIEAVKVAASGGTILTPVDARTVADSVAQHGVVARMREARAALEPLSPRELQVARGVGRGLSNAQIAAEIGCSEATVKAHLSHVFEKVGSPNRVTLALTVHDAQLGPQ